MRSTYSSICSIVEFISWHIYFKEYFILNVLINVIDCYTALNVTIVLGFEGPYIIANLDR